MRHHKGQHSPHHSSPGHPHKSHHAKNSDVTRHPHNAKGDGSEQDWGYASGNKLHVTENHPLDGDGGIMTSHELQHADYHELTGGYSTE